MNNTFSPSFGARMEEFANMEFDVCVRMPFLPPACEALHTKVVHLSTDGCFYRCIYVEGAWQWERVTTGTYRQYTFPVTPVTPTGVVINYAEYSGEYQEGVQYYTKVIVGGEEEYVEFTGTEFDPNETYYIKADYIRKYTFNDIVDRLNDLATEFAKCSVYFKNSTKEVNFGTDAIHFKVYVGLENASMREAVMLMNEMIDHVNRVSRCNVPTYSGSSFVPVADIDNVMMGELVNCTNELIRAVNPYSDTLTDILTKISRLVAANSDIIDSNLLVQIEQELNSYRSEFTHGIRNNSEAIGRLSSEIYRDEGGVVVSRIAALETLYANVVAAVNRANQTNDRVNAMFQTISGLNLSDDADLAAVRAAVKSIITAAGAALAPAETVAK